VTVAIGDLSTCFRLDDGWAFRLKVNGFHLKGTPGWRMPVSVGEALGLETGEQLDLPCLIDGVDHALTVERRADTCAGGEIDVPLSAVGAEEGDLAFIELRHDGYSVTLSRRANLDDPDPLVALLWNCGLRGDDPAVRADPWPRLARALGGGGRTLDGVVERLCRRRDTRLLTLLEAAAENDAVVADGSDWPIEWQYTLAPANIDGALIVRRKDGTLRRLLGVVDGTAQPASELHLGDGGTLWMTLPGEEGLKGSNELLTAPPIGLVPSALRAGWVAWMHAEHLARRAALGGVEWRIGLSEGRWIMGELETGLLSEALAATASDTAEQDQVPPPAKRVHHAYPRNATAFRAIVREALNNGLMAIRSDAQVGFSAQFSDGTTRTGAGLLDAIL
jgi:hypothetical protein